MILTRRNGKPSEVRDKHIKRRIIDLDRTIANKCRRHAHVVRKCGRSLLTQVGLRCFPPETSHCTRTGCMIRHDIRPARDAVAVAIVLVGPSQNLRLIDRLKQAKPDEHRRDAERHLGLALVRRAHGVCCRIARNVRTDLTIQKLGELNPRAAKLIGRPVIESAGGVLPLDRRIALTR